MNDITINNQPLKEYFEQVKEADPSAKVEYQTEVISMTSASHTRKTSRATGRRAKKNSFYDPDAKSGKVRRWTKGEIMLEQLIRQATGVQLEILRTIDQDFKDRRFTLRQFIAAYRKRFQSLKRTSEMSYRKYLDNLTRAGLLIKEDQQGHSYTKGQSAYYRLTTVEPPETTQVAEEIKETTPKTIPHSLVEATTEYMLRHGIAEINLSIRMRE